jgi:microcystin-dependent protein
MFIGGAATTTDSDIGNSGGNNNVTLSTSNLPAHDHTGTTASNGAHVHGMNTGNKDDKNFTSGSDQIPPGDGRGTSNNGATVYNTKSAGAHTHSFTTNKTGGGAAFSIVPEHIKVNYIIKY